MRMRLGLLLAAAGCSAEKGSFLEIVSVASPTAACNFDPSNDLFQTEGFWDPSSDFDRQYILPVTLLNHAADTEEDAAETFGGRDFRTALNDITVSGLDACWYRADEQRASEIGAFDDGELVDCGDLPADQRGFFTGSGRVPEGESTAVVGADVLSEAALQAGNIFGDAFDLDALPADEFGDDAGRAVAWGDYPTLRESRLLLQFQAQGKTNSGKPVESNWFVFPIDVCVNCLGVFCGELETVTCDDGSTGVAGLTVDATESCIPSQALDIECVAVNTCE